VSVRAYMLLDIVDRSCEDAVQMLQRREEVILVDWLEGYPNIITMVEAADKKSLAEVVMPVLGCIEGITEHLHLLVTRDNGIPPEPLTLSNLIPHKRRKGERQHSEKEINATTNLERR